MRTDVHEEGGQGRHSIVTEELVQKFDQCVRGDVASRYENFLKNFHKFRGLICIEFSRTDPLRSQNTVAIIFFVRWRLFEFLGLVGRMRVHPRFRLLFFLCIHELYPSLVTSYDSVKKFVTLFPVALKKRQG